jgi:hypothetical protein
MASPTQLNEVRINNLQSLDRQISTAYIQTATCIGNYNTANINKYSEDNDDDYNQKQRHNTHQLGLS